MAITTEQVNPNTGTTISTGIKIDAPASIGLTTGKEFNADGTPYVPSNTNVGQVSQQMDNTIKNTQTQVDGQQAIIDTNKELYGKLTPQQKEAFNPSVKNIMEGRGLSAQEAANVVFETYGVKTPTPTTPTPTSAEGIKATTEELKTQTAEEKAQADKVAATIKADQEIAAKEAARQEAEKRAIYEEEQRNLELTKQKFEVEQADYEKKLLESQNKAIETIQPLVDAEKAANEAAIKAAEAEQAAALKKAEIENDVAMQKANIAFAKLGLTLTSAAITNTQQIYSQGAIRIAEVRGKFATDIANLRVEANKVEVEHQLAVNKIIDSTNDKIHNSRLNTINSIKDIQSDITLSKKSQSNEIAKIVDDYRKFKINSEKDLYNSIKAANDIVNERTKMIEDKWKSYEEKKKAEINDMVTSGKWGSLSASQQAIYEKEAGLVPGTIAGQINNTIFNNIRNTLDTFLGKDYIIPQSELSGLQTQINNKMKIGGYSIERATAEVMSEYLKNNPRYKEIQAAKSSELTTSPLMNQLKVKMGNAEYQKLLQDISIGTKKIIQDVDGNPIVFDVATNSVVDIGSQIPVQYTGDLSGGELMKVLASGKINGNKFFGVYATGDPNGTNRESLYNLINKVGLSNYLKLFKGTPITEQMIYNTSQKYGIDPIMIATIMAADSSMGTKGIGARNFNPGNVAQFDSLGTTPTKGYTTWQEGVDAVGNNLKKRLDSLSKTTGKSIGIDYSLDNPTFLSSVINGKAPEGLTKSQEKEYLSQMRKYDGKLQEVDDEIAAFTSLYSSVSNTPEFKVNMPLLQKAILKGDKATIERIDKEMKKVVELNTKSTDYAEQLKQLEAKKALEKIKK